MPPFRPREHERQAQDEFARVQEHRIGMNASKLHCRSQDYELDRPAQKIQSVQGDREAPKALPIVDVIRHEIDLAFYGIVRKCCGAHQKEQRKRDGEWIPSQEGSMTHVLLASPNVPKFV